MFLDIVSCFRVSGLSNHVPVAPLEDTIELPKYSNLFHVDQIPTARISK